MSTTVGCGFLPVAALVAGRRSSPSPRLSQGAASFRRCACRRAPLLSAAAPAHLRTCRACCTRRTRRICDGGVRVSPRYCAYCRVRASFRRRTCRTCAPAAPAHPPRRPHLRTRHTFRICALAASTVKAFSRCCKQRWLTCYLAVLRSCVQKSHPCRQIGVPNRRFHPTRARIFNIRRINVH